MGSLASPASHPNGATSRGEENGYSRRRPEESVLYSVVQRWLETFLARARSVPRFVEREFRGCLRCGILAHGFVRVHCDECGIDRVVAFSCKGRGFCASCGGRRMADTAAHLVDRVLPEVPVRQWVLSLPFALRYRLAYDAPLTSAVLGVFMRAVFASLRRRAQKHWGVTRGECGSITFVQRSGDALTLNVHFHSLLLDGVYAPGLDGALRFHPLPPPEDAEVARVVSQIARRIARLLERRGLGPDSDPLDADPLAEEQPLLAQLYGAFVAGRVATRRRAGQRVLRVGEDIDPEALPALEGERCANARGVSLHANVAVPARNRQRLERLCRYVARPPLATKRLSRLDDGRLLYRLKHRWRDGTTHVVFEPPELVEKLAALVPAPRFHLVRYHGILGPCASKRDRVVPGGRSTQELRNLSPTPPSRPSPVAGAGDVPWAGTTGREATDQAPDLRPEEVAQEGGRTCPELAIKSDGCSSQDGPTPRPLRLAWSELLRRVFAIDVLERLVTARGAPGLIVMDNGPEFTSRVLDAWAYENGVRLHFIQPGKPTQNCFVESFNGKFRNECLNEHWFADIPHARRIIEAWRRDYNDVRPHSALGNLSPREFAERAV